MSELLNAAANTDAMNEHLREIAMQVGLGAHAVVVLHGTGWHQAGSELAVPANIILLSLLPYSPELNGLIRREQTLTRFVE